MSFRFVYCSLANKAEAIAFTISSQRYGYRVHNAVDLYLQSLANVSRVFCEETLPAILQNMFHEKLLLSFSRFCGHHASQVEFFPVHPRADFKEVFLVPGPPTTHPPQE